MSNLGTAQRVLVVDDDRLMRELLTFVLGRAGYDVTCAGDGREALALLPAVSPALMVLDLSMPELDGFGVLEALRADPSASPPQVLVLSARYASADADRAIALGAADYLVKPFSNRTLLARLARLPRAG